MILGPKKLLNMKTSLTVMESLVKRIQKDSIRDPFVEPLIKHLKKEIYKLRRAIWRDRPRRKSATSKFQRGKHSLRKRPT